MSQWLHAPLHQLNAKGAYMITAGTFNKVHIFKSPEKLDLLQENLFNVANSYDWFLQAWAVFSNHYHFIAQSTKDSESLKQMIQELHSVTSRLVNQIDQSPGRQVWYQYWDTYLSFPASYFARLNYVHNNPVKHGLVSLANQYKWCSAHWFETQANPSFRKMVNGFKIDKIKVLDEF